MKKILFRIISVVVVILAMVGIALMTSGEIMGDVTMETTVKVKAGVASQSTQEGNSFTVEEEGEYVVYAKCENDAKGLIIGFVLYDENDKIAFYCTGEEFQVESSELKLKPGDYRIEMQYITDEAMLKTLIDEGKGEYYSEEEYAFAENGTFHIKMEYNVKEEGALSIYYLLGVICGVATGLVFVALLVWIIRKLGGKVDLECKQGAFDERQLLARGVAYKYAFFTLMIGMMIISLMELMGVTLFMSFAGVWIVVCISIAVFATVCIMKDAYMSLYENVKGVVIMFAAIGISNLGIGINNLIGGMPLVEKGVLSSGCVNLIVGALFVYILPVFIGRVIYNNKQLEEDEE